MTPLFENFALSQKIVTFEYTTPQLPLEISAFSLQEKVVTPTYEVPEIPMEINNFSVSPNEHGKDTTIRVIRY